MQLNNVSDKPISLLHSKFMSGIILSMYPYKKKQQYIQFLLLPHFLSTPPPAPLFALCFWRRISESGEQVLAGVLKGFELSLSGLIHLSLSHPAVTLCRCLIVILEGRLSSKLICRQAGLLHWLYRSSGGRGTRSQLHPSRYLLVVGDKMKPDKQALI